MILVAEDDEDVREMVTLSLEANGHPVVTATDGRGALEAIERDRPCLVILDLVMPGMTGWQVFAQLEERGLTHTRVCVISALGDRIPASAVAALRKPFELSELRSIAEHYCAHRVSPPDRV